VPCPQRFRILRTQGLFALGYYLAQNSFGFREFALIVKDKGDRKLYVGPFHRIAGSVGEFLGFTQPIHRLSVIKGSFGSIGSEF
jgi:hypothetical protein